MLELIQHPKQMQINVHTMYWWIGSCLLNYNKQKMKICESLESNRPIFFRKDAAESLRPNLHDMHADSFSLHLTSQPIFFQDYSKLDLVSGCLKFLILSEALEHSKPLILAFCSLPERLIELVNLSIFCLFWKKVVIPLQKTLLFDCSKVALVNLGVISIIKTPSFLIFKRHFICNDSKRPLQWLWSLYYMSLSSFLDKKQLSILSILSVYLV